MATLGDLARAALDPLLMPLGFQSGQGVNPDPDRSDQVIFCAPQSVFDQHLAHLDAVGGQLPPGGGGCIDLVVDGSMTGGITGIRLEGCALADLLTDVGRVDEARTVEGWPGASVNDDLQRIRHAMSVLVRATG